MEGRKRKGRREMSIVRVLSSRQTAEPAERKCKRGAERIEKDEGSAVTLDLE